MNLIEKLFFKKYFMQFYKILILNIFTILIFFFLFTEFVLAKKIRLASTTSTENSGLLDYLIPFFEEKTGFIVNVIVAGTGQSLRMGKDGNVDALLVHAPRAEKEFVASGFGVNRKDVMYNDFIFVGPENDPARILGEKNALNVLRKIAKKKHYFVSRGDDSGTHKKELSLWKNVKIKTERMWYKEVGQGMGRVLQIANELGAYTLTDRGTWLTMIPKLSLKLLSEGDPKLYNPYSIIAINPALYPKVNYIGAISLIEWITSQEGKKLIEKYKINGEKLFIPTKIEN